MYSNNRRDGLVQPSFFIVMTGQIDMGFVFPVLVLAARSIPSFEATFESLHCIYFNIPPKDSGLLPRTRCSRSGKDVKWAKRAEDLAHQTHRACGAISCPFNNPV